MKKIEKKQNIWILILFDKVDVLDLFLIVAKP